MVDVSPRCSMRGPAQLVVGLLTLDTLCLCRVFYQKGKIGPRGHGPTSSSSVCQGEKEREKRGGKQTWSVTAPHHWHHTPIQWPPSKKLIETYRSAGCQKELMWIQETWRVVYKSQNAPFSASWLFHLRKCVFSFSTRNWDYLFWFHSSANPNPILRPRRHLTDLQWPDSQQTPSQDVHSMRIGTETHWLFFQRVWRSASLLKQHLP